MSDFLSRVEAILSGVMNFNPKSRAEKLLMKWVGSVGNVEDLETEDKSSVVAAINEIAESSGDIPPEVTNAIETGGIGWTDEEVKEGYDIQWNGNTEGLENVDDVFFKIDSNLHGITSAEDLIGASIDIEGFGIAVVTAEDIETDDNKVYAFGASSLSYPDPVVIIAFEDGTYFDEVYTKGIWFSVLTEGIYVSSLYKEASTQEVVHQIDEKYIPQSSDDTFVIDYSNPRVDDYTNAVARFNANKEVKLRKGDAQIPMTGYDANHCFFGGTVSAYLPGGYVIVVYAHIGPNGENYFWYQYNSPVEAAGLYCEDTGGYFESTNVMGQLQEIGARLASLGS